MSHAIHRFIFRQCHLHVKVGVTHQREFLVFLVFFKPQQTLDFVSRYE